MRSINEFESRRRAAVRRDVLICLKCGSDKVMREQESMACEECGAVLFFVNMPPSICA
jgi:ribosomal protein L37AE/L43A